MPERFARNGSRATSFRLAFNRTQTCTSTCAVKGPHSAPLAAKGFFGKCQNRAARRSTARLWQLAGLNRMLRFADTPIALRLVRSPKTYRRPP
jgi:hypothetical protein